MISDLSRSSSKTPERLVVARTLLQRVKEPVKSITYTRSNNKKLDLVCFVDMQNTVSGVRYNVRGFICGLRCKDKVQVFPNPMEIKQKCSSLKAELCALDFGTSQLCYLAEVF